MTNQHGAPTPPANPPHHRSRGARGDVIALLGCLLATLVMTYPVFLRFKTDLAGAGGDTYTFVWNLWWVRKALLDPGLSVFYTDYLYYPGGISLAFHSLTILNGLLSVPLQPAVGLIGAYNILILTGFVLASWGAYLLARYVTGCWPAALFAGLAFGFSPYHAANAMVDLNIASLQFVPFTFLFLIRWRDRRRYRDAALAGLFLALSGLADWYYLVFVALAAVVLAITWWFRDGRRWPAARTWSAMLLFGGITALVIAPVVIPMAREALREGGFENPGEEKSYSADLLAYGVPSSLHPLLRARVNPFYEKLGGNVFENTVTPGLLVLLLAVYGAWRGDTSSGSRSRADAGREDRLMWVVLGLLAFVLSLGPVLQVGGKALGSRGYLPYRWLIEEVPLLTHARVPSRFAVLVTLSASVLAAFGLRELLGRFEIAARRRALAAAAPAILLAELWLAPFPMTRIPVPAFFEALARDGGDYAILGLPTQEWSATVLAMHYQTTHQKHLVNGFVARVPAGTRQRLDQWDPMPPDYDLLVRSRVHFIVLFTPDGVSPGQARMIQSLSGVPWLRPVDARDASIVVYQVAAPRDSMVEGK